MGTVQSSCCKEGSDAALEEVDKHVIGVSTSENFAEDDLAKEAVSKPSASPQPSEPLGTTKDDLATEALPKPSQPPDRPSATNDESAKEELQDVRRFGQNTNVENHAERRRLNLGLTVTDVKSEVDTSALIVAAVVPAPPTHASRAAAAVSFGHGSSSRAPKPSASSQPREQPSIQTRGAENSGAMFKDLRNRAGQAASTGMQQAGRMRDGAAASAQRARGGGVGAPRSGGARSAPVSAFLKRLAPNGQPWAEYCGVAPPSCEGDGKLTGAWGECMSSAVIFEICNPGWERMPGYKEDGAAGQVVTFAEQCGYGSSTQLLEDAEEAIKQEMEDAEGDPFAFLRQRAKNGMTWKDYTATQEPAGDKNGFVNGAWGDCLTAACIFEDQNPEWSKLSLYSEDGPAGQVIRWFCECGHEISEPALAKTEDATHEAIKRGTELPVYDQVYQCVVGQHNAQNVGGRPPQMSGRKFALLVGCNYAGTRAELQGCINDVHSWCEVLTSIYGFNDKDIVVLTDEPGQDPRRLPTLDNIRNGLRWLVSGAQPGDVLFWQFSGHGTQQESMTMNEEDGLDECLCPCDHQSSGLLVDDEIFDTVVLPLQSGVKLTIILDCCHSGTAVDLPFRWEGDRWEEVGGTVYTAGDVQMFSGCDDHQTSMDVSRAGRASGAMTMSMTRAIKENPGMNYPDLLFRLRDILQQEGYEQFPQLTSSQMFDPRSKKFDLTQGATPNQNPMLGSTGPPRLHPHRQTAGGGDDDDCSIM